MRILGVDPGTRVVGYGLVDRGEAGFTYVECGVIRLAESDPMPARLLTLAGELSAIIHEYRPAVVALETAFHGVNASSALKLGQARGAVMLIAAQHQLELAEYAPALVKRAVVGHGRATKQEVQIRIQRLCRLSREPTSDAADALALALCHAQLGGRVDLSARTARRPR
ncbi:crossover junction endodeoxyribonuclease RuvC [Nannocystis sp.]|uniref:crossover junction endodeoxyribonuclease RuvC n=1 Tax=Nannocystis sp. TaxID=1962667 RepID=UPI0025DAE37C|nr:crossover junction endodeoxyribonuclease RuvC [Nannocystis sp.]MBK7823804.1 crossover junction endodeoxyribonuclease RuvC [Nannocystis sp.]